MIRLLTLVFFAILFCWSSECQAQRHRGWFKRGERVHQHSQKQAAPNLQQQLDASKTPPRGRLFGSFFQPSSPAARAWDSAPIYPKYIGGFHSSHFTDLGVPTGDLGFRGNGIYWTPW